MYVGDYRKLDLKTRRNIYKAYYGIIDKLSINTTLRAKFTGFVFENDSNRFVIKIYDPINIEDGRLTYDPIELVKIGKNKKTTIPYKVDSVKFGIQFNLIDENVYSIDVIDENVESNLVIDTNAADSIIYTNEG